MKPLTPRLLLVLVAICLASTSAKPDEKRITLLEKLYFDIKKVVNGLSTTGSTQYNKIKKQLAEVKNDLQATKDEAATTSANEPSKEDLDSLSNRVKTFRGDIFGIHNHLLDLEGRVNGMPPYTGMSQFYGHGIPKYYQQGMSPYYQQGMSPYYHGMSPYYQQGMSPYYHGMSPYYQQGMSQFYGHGMPPYYQQRMAQFYGHGVPPYYQQGMAQSYGHGVSPYYHGMSPYYQQGMSQFYGHGVPPYYQQGMAQSYGHGVPHNYGHGMPPYYGHVKRQHYQHGMHFPMTTTTTVNAAGEPTEEIHVHETHQSHSPMQLHLYNPDHSHSVVDED